MKRKKSRITIDPSTLPPVVYREIMRQGFKALDKIRKAQRKRKKRR